ncbi:hypothetical protein ABPG75_006567 [Micractinium tetrahymenae]
MLCSRQLAVSEDVLAHTPGAEAGLLTFARSMAVCRKAVARRARELGLAPLLLTGPSMKGQPPSDKVLAQVLEAVLGAVYADGEATLPPGQYTTASSRCRPDAHRGCSGGWWRAALGLHSRGPAVGAAWPAARPQGGVSLPSQRHNLWRMFGCPAQAHLILPI